MIRTCPTCKQTFEDRRKTYCSVPCWKHRLLDPARAEAHFWSRVNKNTPTGCWEWTKARDKWGYGDLRWEGKHMQPHRVVWKMLRGEPGDLDVLHKCNNPPCCNPDHLYLGTDADNARDRVMAGTHTRGEMTKCNKLTEAAARDIWAQRPEKRTNDGRAQRLAEKYGVLRTAINAIWRGATWKHVQ